MLSGIELKKNFQRSKYNLCASQDDLWIVETKNIIYNRIKQATTDTTEKIEVDVSP